MPKALTKDVVNSRLAADGRDVILVGEYINASTKSEFTCCYGHSWEARPGCVLSGDGCPHCSGRAKLSIDIVNDRLISIVSDARLTGEYVNALTKSEFKCSKGHFWHALPSNVMKGHGCPECLTMTKQAVNEKIKGFGVELSSDWNGYREKSKFKCENGHEWVGFLSNVMRSKGCARCHGHARHTKESVNDLLKSQGRTVRQIDECKYAKPKNEFTCEKGHIWMALLDNILSGKGCPHCYGVKDCIYVWQSEGEIFNDKNVYKIGVTKTSKGRGRIHQCAKASGRKPKILRLEKVKDASTLEKQLLSIGRRPDYSYKFDGYSEMRALNDSELAKVLDMIDNAKDHLND